MTDSTPAGDTTGIIIQKPVHLLNKKLKADFKALFTAMGKATVKGVTQDWAGLAEGFIDAGAALGLETTKEERGWLLIRRALDRAVVDLVREQVSRFERELPEPGEMADKLDWSLEQAEVVIDHTFFNHPAGLPLLQDIKAVLAAWLEQAGLNMAQAGSVAGRLPSYFTFALNREWATRPDDYTCLKEIETPFTKADRETRAWLGYYAWLNQQLDEPLFGETFSLRQVYLPLRAYWEEEQWPHGIGSDHDPSKHPKVVRHVVQLEEELESWLESEDKGDAVRIISGGPGSGKSSAVRHFAATHAALGERTVLLIPLHIINPDARLADAVGEFLTDDDILAGVSNPLGDGRDGRQLLLILDGLDELTGLGKEGRTATREFAENVQRKVTILNQRQIWVKVIISGRDIPVQETRSMFREIGRVIHLLPYSLPESDRKKDHWIDPGELIGQDQRHEWWRAYGRATGDGLKEMPPELDRDRLAEITAQPLLNYLVALARAGGMEINEQTNLNQVYSRLFSQVYDRVWAAQDRCGPGGDLPPGRRSPGVRDLELDDFEKCMESLAVAMWHGNSRTASIADIKGRLESDKLNRIMEQLRTEEGGLARLLTAFYVRRSGLNPTGQKTFEFTHKSFGEYLTARRLVRLIRKLSQGLAQNRNGDTWAPDETRALVEWLYLCGPTALDKYVLSFVRDEVALVNGLDNDLVAQWQTDLSTLFSRQLAQDMPVEQMQGTLPSTFQQQCRYARNAGETLLAALNACARMTGSVSPITHPSPTAFGSWLKFVQGQRSVFSSLFRLYPGRLVTYMLDLLDLSTAVLTMSDLFRAGLRQADLSGAYLTGAYLTGADLTGAYLTGAYLRGADLTGADLSGAGLREADLRGADLTGADLTGAYLTGAYLRGADLREARFGSGVRIGGLAVSKDELLAAVEQGLPLREETFLEMRGE